MNPLLPMGERGRMLRSQPPQRKPRVDQPTAGKTPIFATQPPHQVPVHMPPKRFQRRCMEPTVVVRPAPKDRVEHVREIAKLLVALELQMQNPSGLGAFAYNLRFPGQYYQAETGLNQNVNRDYDPLTAKYVESDPIGLGGGTNTYTYSEQNPVAVTDE